MQAFFSLSPLSLGQEIERSHTIADDEKIVNESNTHSYIPKLVSMGHLAMTAAMPA